MFFCSRKVFAGVYKECDPLGLFPGVALESVWTQVLFPLLQILPSRLTLKSQVAHSLRSILPGKMVALFTIVIKHVRMGKFEQPRGDKDLKSIILRRPNGFYFKK